jgi:flagellar basal-body rod protein FlgG
LPGRKRHDRVAHRSQQPGQNGSGTLMQGTLEASNVNVVEEMVNMIETQRAYEINSKAISAVDGMLKYINQNM